MDDRLVQFVRGLRLAGVRVSVAEAEDALRAMQVTGVVEKGDLRDAFRGTLVKDAADFAAFDTLFPIYFGSNGPPLQDATEDLSPDDEALLRAALEALTGRLKRLMDWLTSGDGPTQEQLERLAQQAGASRPRRSEESRWITRRMLRDMGFGDLERLLEELAERLREAGMSQAGIEAVLGVVESNREALAEQVARQVGQSLERARSEHPPDFSGADAMDLPFDAMTPDQQAALRREVTRLAARLRSRASLRQRPAGRGRLDAKRTLRANQRYGGVPLEIKWRRRKRKPRLVLICDVSTSMRPLASFFLHLVYELSDQVAKARAFVFNADLVEVTSEMTRGRPAEAVGRVLEANPPGHYATDLGGSLETFVATASGSVDRRTSVIVLGDGRNNFRPAREDLLATLGRRARRLIWLTPEDTVEWGTGDSDMLSYAPHCSAVYHVTNMAQLSAAVDRLLGDR